MVEKFHPRRLLPALTAGLVVGLLEIALATSFAALIFAGELSSYVPLGIGFALMGTILSGILLALFTSFPGTVGGNQDVPAAFMAVVVAAIVAAMPAGATSQETFLTAVAAITLTTLLAAIFFLVLGVFKLGALVRFLPYPVVGGFLAGTGWLLVTGAFQTMIDVPTGSTFFSLIMQPENLIYWLPGLILAVVMLLLLRRSDHFLIMPGLVLGGTLLFYLLAWLSGTSLAELGAQGFLLGPFPTESLWQPLTPSDMAQVNWSVIVSQAASLATIFLVSSIALLLNVSGLELATKRDMKLNRELTAAGLANLASGVVSGFINFQQLSLSALNFKSKAFTLIYAGPSAQVRRQLEHGADGDRQESVRFSPSLEEGVEWCENQILQQAGLDTMDHAPALSEQLAEILPDAKNLSELLPYFNEIKVDTGSCLIRQGYPPRDLYFVQDGQVTVTIGLEERDPVRLETMSGGVVGEIGFYLGNERTASIVADVPTTVYRLSRGNLRQMEEENPQAAANLHRLISHLLSERASHLVTTVTALER